MTDPTPSGPALPAALLDVIACPTCHGALTLSAAGVSLTCAACAVAYPVTDGVPVLLVDEARPLDPRAQVQPTEEERDDAAGS